MRRAERPLYASIRRKLTVEPSFDFSCFVEQRRLAIGSISLLRAQLQAWGGSNVLHSSTTLHTGGASQPSAASYPQRSPARQSINASQGRPPPVPPEPPPPSVSPPAPPTTTDVLPPVGAGTTELHSHRAERHPPVCGGRRSALFRAVEHLDADRWRRRLRTRAD